MPLRRRQKRERPGLQSEATQTKKPRTIYRGKIAAGAAEGQQLASQPDFTIHTDGACEPNPGVGGYAYVIDGPNGRTTAAVGVRYTTNNRCELLAILDALSRTPLGSSVAVFSDSKYCVNGASVWVHGWARSGWIAKTTGDTVANDDLWRQLLTLLAGRRVRFGWVRGHSGHTENELANSLAEDALGFPYEVKIPDLREPDGVVLEVGR